MIRVSGVAKYFSGHKALDGVDLEIKSGNIHGLLGPNGAGKTTLLRILNCILLPDRGSVLYKNKVLTFDDVRTMGYLPEERGLYKKMSVWDQILYFGRLRGLTYHDARQKARHWLEKLELTSWQHKKAQDLSKGMQQKVQFIVAIVHDPECIILDEPFSGFDPVNAALIRDEIVQMKNEGRTILLSTHNMNSVEELCDDITLIHKARVVLQGQVNDIKKQYNSGAYFILFKGSFITFTHALWTTGQVLDRIDQSDSCTLKIQPLTPRGINAVLEAVIPHVEILEVRQAIPTMSEIFISAIGETLNTHVADLKITE